MHAPQMLPTVVALAATAAMLLLPDAHAQDAVDALQHGKVPADMIRAHGYSDFTDPLGKFLDLLAAGALADAKSLQPDACEFWAATRQNSAFSGKFWVWDTEIDLDTLCRQR